ncbi:MAG: hypothetical protein MUQ75_03060 [Crocinitomicaceae bacterium]|nr:hypothetical protein [Crocinitomicaceae bacterium]
MARTLLVHEVIELVEKQKTKTDKVKVLKENETWALKDIIRGSMDSTLSWNLPAGEPPYTASRPESTATTLLRENEKFKYFVKGGPGTKLSAVKREQIFIGMLEGIHPNDARLVIDMINKKPPKGLTRPVVKEAFPGLLRDA